jgi:hypothetical protein
MELKKNLEETVVSNYEKIRSKLASQINFWARFNLSLPGRIEISKTMLYSQLNYFGCLLNFSSENIKSWEDQIFSFVKGNLNISKSKAFTTARLGGLGLFAIKEFLDAQKYGWVIRSKKEPNDNWKIYMTSQMLTSDTVFQKNHNESDSTINGIIKAFKNFYVKFLGVSNNFKRAPILNNAFLTVTPRTGIYVQDEDLPVNIGVNGLDWFKNLTISKLTERGNIFTKQEIEARCGTIISGNLYKKLCGVYRTGHMKYGSGDGNLGLNVSQCFRTWNKGSRRFRNILCNSKLSYVPHNLIKFANNTDTVIDESCSKHINTLWSIRAFSNAKRTFLFKLYNNLLPYNTVLSHFVRGKSRNCTICDTTGNQEMEDETVLHLFYDCVPVNELLTQFFSTISRNKVTDISRHELFCCFKRFGDEKNLMFCLAAKIFINYIWEVKMRASTPTLVHLVNYFNSEFKLIISVSGIFRQKLLRSGLGWHF